MTCAPPPNIKSLTVPPPPLPQSQSCSAVPESVSFSHWWGRNEGIKIVVMSSNFYRGTTATHATLQASQSLFDLVVTEMSARNEISIQSLLKIRFRNDVSGYLIYSLRAWVSCGFSKLLQLTIEFTELFGQPTGIK